MKKCPHSKFHAETKFFLTDIPEPMGVRQLVLRLKIVCLNCKKNFLFKGPVGFSTVEPMSSPDGYELRIPMDYPEAEDEELKEPEEPSDTGTVH